MSKRKILFSLLALCLSLSVLAGCTVPLVLPTFPTLPSETEETSGPEQTEPEQSEPEQTINGFEVSESVTEASGSVPASDETVSQEHPEAPHLSYLDGFSVPEYSGEPYIVLNNGLPFFDTEDLDTEAYEIYYALDPLGRCTLADAVVGTELMPDKKRGNISSVKPSGWQSVMYPQSLVDGESLYNRCHLIAFGLAGEEANPYNLVTGTRYFNTKGMNSFENMTIDYIRETGNHVRYRVTPVFTGDNLVCDGAVMEAWSIEDEGDGIGFCIYAYNVQPGICIDYATGDNWIEGGELPSVTETEPEVLPTLEEDYEGTFILNTKKKTIHLPECEGAQTMSEKNRQEYTGSYNRLIEDGYVPCRNCLP